MRNLWSAKMWGAGRVSLIAAALLAVAPLLAQQKAPETKPHPPHTLLAQMQNELSEVADDVMPSVVTILCVKIDANAPAGELAPRRGTSNGSGVIIRADGWILTNNHVVVDADRIVARLRDGREFRGRVYRDPHSDLALRSAAS